MKQLKQIGILGLLLPFFACGGGDDAVVTVVKDPTSATLTFPLSNSECTEGTAPTATESTVTFKWNAGTDTDSYGLLLKNLNTGSSTTYTSANTSLPIKIKIATPYSWSVISKSKSTATTATSPTWKFYNAGAGNSSYAPFPAELVSPANNSSSTVTNNLISLDWTGSDVDNDIDNYTVYFGETNPPAEHQTGIDESLLENISVASGKTYYWKIDTKDSTGNISTSDIFKVSIN